MKHAIVVIARPPLLDEIFLKLIMQIHHLE
jgi:hypothetical protein